MVKCAAVTTVTMTAVATAVSASATTPAMEMATLLKLNVGVPMRSCWGVHVSLQAMVVRSWWWLT
eukprot:3148821-Rhodomonas_salina.1